MLLTLLYCYKTDCTDVATVTMMHRCDSHITFSSNSGQNSPLLQLMSAAILIHCSAQSILKKYRATHTHTHNTHDHKRPHNVSHRFCELIMRMFSSAAHTEPTAVTSFECSQTSGQIYQLLLNGHKTVLFN